MKVKYFSRVGEQCAEVNISYITDKDSKYLVVVDDKNKVKYIPDTYSGEFENYSIQTLIYRFGQSLGLNNALYEVNGGVGKVCHADDFYRYFKPDYELVGVRECRNLNIKY